MTAIAIDKLQHPTDPQEADGARAKALGANESERHHHLVVIAAVRATRDAAPEPAPLGRLLSPRRRAARLIDAATLDLGLRVGGISNAEAGAACDMNREQMRETRAGERPVELALFVELAPEDEPRIVGAPLSLARVAFLGALFARAHQADPIALAIAIGRWGSR